MAGDLGIHKVDLIHYILEDEIEQVSAFQGALDKVNEYGEPIEVCDNIVCTLKDKKRAHRYSFFFLDILRRRR